MQLRSGAPKAEAWASPSPSRPLSSAPPPRYDPQRANNDDVSSGKLEGLRVPRVLKEEVCGPGVMVLGVCAEGVGLGGGVQRAKLSLVIVKADADEFPLLPRPPFWQGRW